MPDSHLNLTQVYRLSFWLNVFFPYLQIESGDSLLKYFSKFSNCQFVSFEMIEPFDSFGKQMVSNLNYVYETKLNTLMKYHSPVEIENRFLEFGWKTCKCQTMFEVWDNNILDKFQ